MSENANLFAIFRTDARNKSRECLYSMPCKEEEDRRSTGVPSIVRSRVRLSEGNPKETVKREQKKFIFYAEREFLRPSGQFYLSIYMREHLRGIGLVICAHFSVSTYREV